MKLRDSRSRNSSDVHAVKHTHAHSWLRLLRIAFDFPGAMSTICLRARHTAYIPIIVVMLYDPKNKLANSGKMARIAEADFSFGLPPYSPHDLCIGVAVGSEDAVQFSHQN